MIETEYQLDVVISTDLIANLILPRNDPYSIYVERLKWTGLENYHGEVKEIDLVATGLGRKEAPNDYK